MNDLQLGLTIWPQNTTWNAQRDVGLRAEALGYDQIWTWDHFLPIIGDPSGANFECWQILAAWGALTTRIGVGALVSSITYRHPTVIAKMAATLDHITNGRAILGLGAGWFQLEHDQYGLHFGTVGERLARLAEGTAITRMLLDQPTATFEGKYYQVREAMAEPKPIQAKLPIMIGGGGEKKTLRITAQHADYWNGFGTPEEAAHKLNVLRQHCAEVGRDPNEIIPTIMVRVIVRDDAAAIAHVKTRMAAHHRISAPLPTSVASLEGGPDVVAEGLAAYWRAGVRGIIAGMAEPYDEETMERLATEVRPRLRALVND